MLPLVVPVVVLPLVVLPLVVPVVVLPLVVPVVVLPLVLPDVLPLVVPPEVVPELVPEVVPAFSDVVQALKRLSDAHSRPPVNTENHLLFIGIRKSGTMRGASERPSSIRE